MNKELLYKKETVYKKSGKSVVNEAFAYAEGYKAFLDAAKTEREAVRAAIAMLSVKGFKEYKLGDKISAGDRLYYNNRGKNLFAFAIGKNGVEDGIRITASHVDAPRIDLKQCPLYDDGGMAYFKTHYYGGIRKYQWVTTPLALHGVVITKDGKSIDVCIGEDNVDPIFYISDLLPHLGREQAKLPMSDAIKGEQLNVLVGNMPNEDDDSVKNAIMALINEKYGIAEDDFFSSELCVVPAAKARDIGFDRALIGAYGHDDRVCAYPSLTAMIEALDAGCENSLMCILADKEETGSDGVSGIKSDILIDIINEIAAAFGISAAKVRANSKCLSADVSAGYDPNFPEVYEKLNSAFVGCGTIFTKYTGSGGKGSTNDANPEFIAWLRAAMEKYGVVWQSAELGKVDAGGGGTVAKHIAQHNIETIDLGVAVISMHAPYEVVSKVDVYETHRAINAFYCFNR